MAVAVDVAAAAAGAAAGAGNSLSIFLFFILTYVFIQAGCVSEVESLIDQDRHTVHLSCPSQNVI